MMINSKIQRFIEVFHNMLLRPLNLLHSQLSSVKELRTSRIPKYVQLAHRKTEKEGNEKPE